MASLCRQRCSVVTCPPTPLPHLPNPAQVFIGSALVPYFARYTGRYKKAQQVAAEEAAQAAAVDALEGGAGGKAGGSVQLSSGKLGSSSAAEAGEAAEAGTPDGSSDSEPKAGTGKLSAAQSVQSFAVQSAEQQQEPQQQVQQEQPGVAADGSQRPRRGLSKRFQTWKNWWI